MPLQRVGVRKPYYRSTLALAIEIATARTKSACADYCRDVKFRVFATCEARFCLCSRDSSGSSSSQSPAGNQVREALPRFLQ